MSIPSSFDVAAQAIAPELEIYVVEQSADVVWPTPWNCAAYTIRPHCSAQQRDWLLAQGRWSGWRPLICFVDPPCESQEDQGIFLHELAHCLPPPAPRLDLPPSDTERLSHLARFARLCDYVASAEPWLDHEWRFIRRGLHVWYRAVNYCRWTLAPRHLLLTGKLYGTSDVDEYAGRLGDEPHELRSKTFQEIETIPPPPAFVELFEADKQRWHKQKELQRDRAISAA